MIIEKLNFTPCSNCGKVARYKIISSYQTFLLCEHCKDDFILAHPTEPKIKIKNKYIPEDNFTSTGIIMAQKISYILCPPSVKERLINYKKFRRLTGIKNIEGFIKYDSEFFNCKKYIETGLNNSKVKVIEYRGIILYLDNLDKRIYFKIRNSREIYYL
jgi:hypothetical protein